MNTSTPVSRALVREPTPSFQHALVHGHAERVDVSKLISQHAAITSILRSWGLALRALAPLPEAPDACFVEDRAVIVAGVALLTRSAVPSRAPETESVARALEGDLELIHMTEGTLDGGDVLQVGNTVLVGRSARTDARGTAMLEALARRHNKTLRVVDVQGLHLKCVCSAPDPETMLFAEGLGLEQYVPSGVRAITTPTEESYAANVVGWEGNVLVPTGYPVTAERLQDAGYKVHLVDNSEFAKRDGSLTCLSVLF